MDTFLSKVCAKLNMHTAVSLCGGIVCKLYESIAVYLKLQVEMVDHIVVLPIILKFLQLSQLVLRCSGDHKKLFILSSCSFSSSVIWFHFSITKGNTSTLKSSSKLLKSYSAECLSDMVFFIFETIVFDTADFPN